MALLFVSDDRCTCSHEDVALTRLWPVPNHPRFGPLSYWGLAKFVFLRNPHGYKKSSPSLEPLLKMHR
jgi:hypothetical protein